MNISGIPAATNYAAIQSPRLTQLSSSPVVKQESTTSNSHQAKLITTSLIASDNGYSKEDAIMKQWNRQGSFNIYDVMNGGKVNLQDPDPDVEVLQEFEKQLQTSGIRKEVDWSGLMFDLRGIGFDADDAAYTIGADDLSRKIDYLASRYAAVEDKIKHTATGDARAEQLKKLNEMYQNALDEIAEGYSGIVGSFLEKNNVSGEKEKIYSSIVSGVESKVEEYHRILSDNSALEALKGTQDQWLLDDDAYVASVLREHAEDSATVQTGSADAPYTLNDLKALAQQVSALSAMEKPGNTSIYTIDEARIGLDFSMLAMKTDALRNNGRISDTMAVLLQKNMDGFMQSFLDLMDNQLSENRRAGVAVGDQAGFATLKRNIVWDVYSQTMKHYRNSGDAMQALIRGAEYGAKVSAQSPDRTYRYQNNISYWTNFFGRDTSRLEAYESPDSTFQKYLADWTEFQSRLPDGKAAGLDVKA